MLIVLLIACEPPTPARTSPQSTQGTLLPGEGGYERVLENVRLEEGLRVIGPDWNNTWIRGCEITDTEDDGIFVRDVERLRISGCTLRNIGGQGGIRLSIGGSTDGVEILDNVLEDLAENGINAPQRSDEGIDHTNLVIRGNRVRRSGLEGDRGLTHGMYVQASGARIENNRLEDIRDGNGLSLRSYGTVRGNVVLGYGGSGIRYFNDHRGTGGRLVIENNQVLGSGPGAALSILYSDSPESWIVDGWEVSHNTLVAPVAFSMDEQHDADRLTFTGNLLIADTPTIGAPLGINVEGASTDIRSIRPDSADLNLAAIHPQRGSVDGPAALGFDIEGDPRPTTGRDPGADQVVDGL